MHAIVSWLDQDESRFRRVGAACTWTSKVFAALTDGEGTSANPLMERELEWRARRGAWQHPQLTKGPMRAFILRGRRRWLGLPPSR
jgi:hypothetical protein